MIRSSTSASFNHIFFLRFLIEDLSSFVWFFFVILITALSEKMPSYRIFVCVKVDLQMVSFAAVVWSRHSTRFLSQQTTAMKGD